MSLHQRKSEKPGTPFRQRNILMSLGERDRQMFLAKCSRQRFRRRAKLYTEGAAHKASYLIESGVIRTFYESPTGKEITLGYWSAGDLIGGPYFFDDSGIHVWSAEAVENSVVLAIPGRSLKELVTRSSRIASVVLDAISFKLLWDSLLLQMLATRSVSSRLALLLVKLTALYGTPSADGVLIGHRFTQENLANMVGTTREWLNAQLKRLQQDGVLRVENRQILITNLARLKQVAE
jgi:CRP/FNR family transcriptional regulator, cyclic AMP receptor protein